MDQIGPWIKDLGGWAVVVWIVLWLTKRWEVHMSEHSRLLRELIDSLKDKQKMDEAARRTMLEEQARIRREIKDLKGAG